VPHFTLQASAQGPLIDAFVSVSEARRAALVAAGRPVPNVIQIRGLLDTVASGTAIDPSVLATLGLTPTGTTTVNTPTTGANPQVVEQYDVGLLIPVPNGLPLFNQTLPVIAAELLAAQGFHALIGRDILSQCVFVYNGSGFFTLAY
jgi:hypothetical protein